MLDDGSNTIYKKSGSFEIIEDTWDGVFAKFIDFNPNLSIKENLIQYIDSDYLEIWNFGESFGSYSHTTDFYVRIKYKEDEKKYFNIYNHSGNGICICCL